MQHKLREQLANDVYPRWLAIFERKLEENGTGYFVGDSVSQRERDIGLALMGLHMACWKCCILASY